MSVLTAPLPDNDLTAPEIQDNYLTAPLIDNDLTAPEISL